MRLIWIVALTLLAPAAAQAGLTVTGSGNFNGTALVTDVTAPNASFQFSFQTSGTLDASNTAGITGFQYSLGGSPVAATADSVTFYTTEFGGLFDLNFTTPNNPFISLFGPQAFSGSTITPGSYATTAISLTGSDADSIGSGTVTIRDSAALPEPTSMMMAGTGALIMGLGRVFGRKKLGALKSA